MLLKTDDAQWMKSPAAKSLNGDPWRGTAFTWQVTGMMFAQMVPTTLPVFMGLFQFSFATTMAIFVPSMLLHGKMPLRDAFPSILHSLSSLHVFFFVFVHLSLTVATSVLCCDDSPPFVPVFLP